MANIKLAAMEVKNKHFLSCLSDCYVTIADGQHQAVCHGGEVQGVGAGIPGCPRLYSGDTPFPLYVHSNMCWLP